MKASLKLLINIWYGICPGVLIWASWHSTLQFLNTIFHYSDVIMSAITGVTSVYSTVCSRPDQRKHQSSASLAVVRGIHRWPVNSPHKGAMSRKMFPFDDVIMYQDNHQVNIKNPHDFLVVPVIRTKGQQCGKHAHVMMSSWSTPKMNHFYDANEEEANVISVIGD